MHKISTSRFKSKQKSRLRTSQNQITNSNIIKIEQKSRFSCFQPEQMKTKDSLFVKNENKKSNFSTKIEFSNHENLLRSMIQGSQRKRFQILSNLIKKTQKKILTSQKNSQSFRKIRNFKTEQKQNDHKRAENDHKKAENDHKKAENNNKQKQNDHKKTEKCKTVSNQKGLSTRKSQQSVFSCSHENLFSQRRKPYQVLSQKDSKFLRNSFNKRIKEIKLRKYFHKEQLQKNPINIFQAYGATLIGQKHAQNQDSICFSQGVYVLCDGHGSNGKHISNFVSQAVHHALKKCLEQHKIDQTMVLQMYRKIDLQLQNSNFDISFSGCTCVALLRSQNNLYCISLGDSRAILCRGYTVWQISKTQKPDNPEQKERIQNYGGVVRKTQISRDKFVGPMRVWAPGKNSWGPGLALSRAFGDKASRRYGVISVPEVSRISLTSDQQFIVIGSDGLFDFFSDQEISQYVRKLLKDEDMPKQQIANQLVKQARTKWGQDSDDITCILVFM